MQKKVNRGTKKKGGSNKQQMRNMAVTGMTHLAAHPAVQKALAHTAVQKALSDPALEKMLAHPAVQKALARHDVQGHVDTAVSALSSAAEKTQNQFASAALNTTANYISRRLQHAGKRGATKKVKGARKGKKQ